MRHWLRTLACLLAISAATRSCPAADQIRWETDLDAAFQQARKLNRPLLLHFWTPECVPCRRLEKNVFNQSRVVESLNDFFVPVKINANEHPSLASRYDINSVPKDVIVTADNYELNRLFTPQDPERYVAQLSAVAFRSGGPSPMQRTQSRIATAATEAAKSLDERWGASVARARHPNPEVASTPTQATRIDPRPDSANQVAAQEVINRFARQNQSGADESDPRTERSWDDNQNADERWVDNRRPEATDDVRAAPVDEFQPDESRPRAAQRVARQQPQRRAEPRSSKRNPPLGMDGYCPVTLVKQEQWVKGDRRFGVIHRGRTYLFRGPQEKETFFADPDAYSPVLAGIDAVELTENREPREGKRAHGVVYRKRVYLFSTEANLEQFWSQPERYASPIRQAMETGTVDQLFR